MSDACPICGPDFVRWLAADPAQLVAWRALPRRRVAPGELLQAQGQPPAAVWFVEQGLLRSHVLNADGREHNGAFHAEQNWAGVPPPRGAPAAAVFAIDALEHSLVVELSHAALADWLRDRPEWQAALTDGLLANLRAMAQRESALLMDSAEQRYTAFLAQQPGLAGRVALHQVASYLGITNVALSRIRRRMRERQARAGAD